MSTFVLTVSSLQLKPLTPACSSFWPFPKCESRADYSTGAHYVDEQDTSTVILFSANFGPNSCDVKQQCPPRTVTALPVHCLRKPVQKTQSICKLQSQTIHMAGLLNNLKLLLASFKNNVRFELKFKPGKHTVSPLPLPGSEAAPCRPCLPTHRYDIKCL